MKGAAAGLVVAMLASGVLAQTGRPAADPRARGARDAHAVARQAGDVGVARLLDLAADHVGVAGVDIGVDKGGRIRPAPR